jgi:peroxiredoxin
MFPLLSDFWPHGEVTQKYNALTDSGFGDRVVYLIDKKGIIRLIERGGIETLPDNETVFEQLSKLA